MNTNDDHLWNDFSNEKAFEKKMKQWQQRDWRVWLNANVKFPFDAIREEDDWYDISDGIQEELFGVGHKMTVLEIDTQIESDEEIIVKVRENRKTGYVPLYDLEVTPKSDANYWPVMEYVVWFANR